MKNKIIVWGSLGLLLLALGLHFFELLVVNQTQLVLHDQQVVLVEVLLSQLLLVVSVLVLGLLLLSLGSLLAESLLLSLVVLLHLDAAITHIVALHDLGVPELLDRVELIVLHIREVRRHLVHRQRALAHVTVRHVLLLLALLAVLDVLEAEVRNVLRDHDCDRWLV